MNDREQRIQRALEALRKLDAGPGVHGRLAKVARHCGVPSRTLADRWDREKHPLADAGGDPELEEVLRLVS